MKLLEAQLPSGWTWQRISDRYRITKKPRDLKFAASNTIPFVPMEAVPANGREDVRFEMRMPSQIASGTYFEKGDVLLSKITPSFENEKQGLAQNIPANFGIASTEIIPLQPLDSASNSRFLFYYLLHPEVRATLAGKMEGSTGRQRVPEHAVAEFPLPVLPKPEQENISAILRNIQRVIETEERLIATARELKQSAMRQLFTHGLRGEPQKETEIGPMPESWQRTLISECGEVVTGTTPKTSERRFYDNGSFHFIAPGDLGSTTKIYRAAKAITEAGLEVSRVLPKNAVCFVCIGSSIGKVGITTQDRSTTNQQINAIVVNEHFEPLFVCYLLVYFSEYVSSFASPSPVPIMSKGKFEQVSFYATLDKTEQAEIAHILCAIDDKIEIHERKRTTLQELFKTMLHKLMTAEIRVTNLDIDVSGIKS